jgi:hypothetical protein
MKKNILITALVLICSGCATKTIPLAPAAMDNFRGKTIACAFPAAPSFEAMHGGKSLLGRSIGQLAQTIKGDQIIRDNQIADPAQETGRILAGELAAAYDLKVLPPVQPERKKSCQADLILETRTTYWGFCYFLSDWNNYFVTYRSGVRLIDTRTGTCLAAGESLFDGRNGSLPYSYDGLTGGQAAGLKAELKTAQEKSAAEFRQKILRPGLLRGAADNR